RGKDRVSGLVVYSRPGSLRSVLSRLSRRAAPVCQTSNGDGELRGPFTPILAVHQGRGRFGRPAAEHLAPDAATGSAHHTDPEMADEEGSGFVGRTVREGLRQLPEILEPIRPGVEGGSLL